MAETRTRQPWHRSPRWHLSIGIAFGLALAALLGLRIFAPIALMHHDAGALETTYGAAVVGLVARQSAYPTDILGVEAYRQQVQELARRPDSYVVAVSKTARFDAGRSLRGVALDPQRLEQHLGIEPDLWQVAPGVEY
jgi:hypothetical protein